MKIKTLILGLGAVLFSACTFIPALPGAEQVVLFKPEQVSRCSYLGAVKVNVMENAGLFKRDPAKIALDLQALARNSAVDMGGDTLTVVSPVSHGSQVFNVYHCLK